MKGTAARASAAASSAGDDGAGSASNGGKKRQEPPPAAVAPARRSGQRNSGAKRSKGDDGARGLVCSLCEGSSKDTSSEHHLLHLTETVVKPIVLGSPFCCRQRCFRDMHPIYLFCMVDSFCV